MTSPRTERPASEPEEFADLTGQKIPDQRLVVPLAKTALAMVIGMSLYQIAKYLLVPGLSLIESNIITVLFSTVVAVVAAYFILRKRHAFIQQILREVAERRRAEREIKLLNEDLEYHILQLETANKELESFSYSVSHDLRAPLRHVIGYVELLQKNATSVLDEKTQRYLTTISDSAKRMGTLIDDLLTFSRIGRMEIKKSVFNLEQVLNEALDDLEPDTAGRDIDWRITPLPDVYADRSLIRLVLMNLVSNAIKFTSQKPRAIIEIGPMSSGADETVVFVRDNGVGFDMKYSDKLFGVFQRLHSAGEFEGTGIGLANVQRIINRHGGKSWAEGAVGKGATFYFSIPNPRRTEHK